MVLSKKTPAIIIKFLDDSYINLPKIKELSDNINDSAGRKDFVDESIQRTNPKKLITLIKNNQLVGAVVNDETHPKFNEIVGCMQIKPHSDDGTDATTQYCGMFFVRSDFRGTGIGVLLYEFNLKHGFQTNKKRVQITVWAPNDGTEHKQSKRLCDGYEAGGAVRKDEKDLLDVYPEFEGHVVRPCKVVYYDLELNKTKLFLVKVKLGLVQLVRRGVKQLRIINPQVIVLGIRSIFANSRNLQIKNNDY
jgi:GNAT superfamily N-acetyltransferase